MNEYAKQYVASLRDERGELSRDVAGELLVADYRLSLPNLRQLRPIRINASKSNLDCGCVFTEKIQRRDLTASCTRRLASSFSSRSM
jgi:hypothetical protein